MVTSLPDPASTTRTRIPFWPKVFAMIDPLTPDPTTMTS
jgi:hypothetical protein